MNKHELRNLAYWIKDHKIACWWGSLWLVVASVGWSDWFFNPRVKITEDWCTPDAYSPCPSHMSSPHHIGRSLGEVALLIMVIPFLNIAIANLRTIPKRVRRGRGQRLYKRQMAQIRAKEEFDKMEREVFTDRPCNE